MLPEDVVKNKLLIADFCGCALESLKPPTVHELIRNLEHYLKMTGFKLSIEKKSVIKTEEEIYRLSELIKNLKFSVKDV